MMGGAEVRESSRLDSARGLIRTLAAHTGERVMITRVIIW
jgi:hypothetical protein